MTPLVSIVIPCYNAAPWLGPTLDSALAQTHARCEIVVIDDGSTDASGEIARRYASAKTLVIEQVHAGQSAAFNHGIRVAQGEYLVFLDADDLLHPEKIARQLLRLQEAQDAVASGAWARFYDNDRAVDFRPEAIWRDLAPVDWLVTSWRGGGMMHGAAWLTPRRIVEAAGPWNEALSLINDHDFFTRMVLASSVVVFCPDARTYYRSGNASSLSASRTPEAWESAFSSAHLAASALLAREDSPRTRAAAADYLQRLIHSAYPQASDLVRAAENVVAGWGGSELQCDGGVLFRTVRGLLGWKLARRLQIAVRP